mgnify:CR=1 FL=1
MGIVNVTPDSFSDRADRTDPAEAIAFARSLIAEGADLLDIGGESTRPGAESVDAEVELSRILPVLRALRDSGVALSVDTRKPEVMRRALAEGADIINDVGGFTAPGAIDAVAGAECGLCVMHMQGDPMSMQQAPRYGDVLEEVATFLAAQIAALQAQGVAQNRIMLDPGIGFGKTLEHNLALMRGLDRLGLLGPLLVGASRKSVIGKLTGREVQDRLAGSLAAMLAMVSAGAAVVRVHDVAATRDALTVWQALSPSLLPGT